MSGNDYINPTYQRTVEPKLVTLFNALKREMAKDINCVKIGVIQAYSPGDASTVPSATVKIAQQQVTSIAPNGTKTIAEYPLLLQVPVIFSTGGGFTLTFPVAAGDECLVLFNDRAIDAWVLNGAGAPPSNPRVHDMSDGFALVGVRSNPRALAGISASAVQLRSDDGETVIEVSPGKIRLAADEVELHSRNKITFDAGGTGFVYQPDQIDTYTDGVPTTGHPPNPPEVPT